jgi:dUTP pyrophosphatase
VDPSLKVVQLLKDAKVPERKTSASAGLDLCPYDSGTVLAGQMLRFRTGLAFELPFGSVGYIKTRSSRFAEGFLIEGVIDSDYRGDVSLQIRNVSDRVLYVQAGERYAQLIVEPCLLLKPETVNELSETQRGTGGFGSTGK